jgi:serine phosphatase RsbU (regulator of sigma subunit)
MGYAARIAALAGAYVAGGKMGLDLAYATSSVTAIWPPTGIALAALVIWGPRYWPGVALGALLTNVDTGVPPGTVLGITVGNTLEALAGAWLLRRVAGFDPSLRRVRDVLSLLAFGALLSTMVSATIGVGSLLAADEIAFSDVDSVWRTWWLGDMGGDLIMAPVLLIAATFRRLERPPGHPVEALVLALAIGGTSAFVFSQETGFTYLLFPLLIWAAMRFWRAGAAGASLITALVAVWLTSDGQGPFAMSDPDERLLLAQTFTAVAGISALLLAAVIAERRRAEGAVHAIASTLQESLLPSRLPELPQVETAVYFRAAGQGQQVGGDFYDLFQTGDGSWALAVGDVRGKGPDAAAMTALARYTLRAAALREKQPSRVLGLLNEAMLWQHGGDDFCTVAYASLDLDGSAASVTLSSGGHPLPLLLRAGGEVEEVGRPGMLLGVEPDPGLEDHRSELEPGDLLVVYTDGLIDAYAPRRVVSPGELRSLLAGCAGRQPADVVRAIEEQLLARSRHEPRDDIAIVVLRLGAARAEPPAERAWAAVSGLATHEPG